jgi:hypothetical protein
VKTFLILITFLLNNSSYVKAINPNLTIEYNKAEKRVELKWQNSFAGVNRFVLQRSADNLTWNDIYTSGPGDTKNKLLKFHDHYYEKEKNYYRLKIYSNAGFEYSQPVSLIIGSNTGNWLIYPIPVQNMINLQYNGGEPIQNAVGVFIRNSYGYVLTKKRFSSINRHLQVPVDNLGRGIYEIYIVINDKMVWSQRFVK